MEPKTFIPPNNMSGDGLTDIVRVRNGDVCYWPNLGYGKFGAKITLSNVYNFDYVDQFDPRRVLLADIDGTGTSDLIYFDAKGCHVYFNNSGNSLSRGQEIFNLPLVNNTSYFSTVDLFGDGTACLVWGYLVFVFLELRS
ncbi:MAG: hypothetical protein LBU83_11670 [Bacteroidales bacterium]|jgi:hypothetical protein|nr:hypothetical protein [Bacteroidales bacterium]